MSKIKDVGKSILTREERKAERKKAWKRPSKKADREAAKEQRLQDWRERNGMADSTDTGNS